ncbi:MULTISPECIES: hypothetical protein [Brevibacillus]|uniref:hypothetical protein n=1 Tax=Brevibacillus TaxID=55080 RepID=UPI000D10FB3B|nr:MULTISPECIES: hypothetical protein [Brevibacillus]PSJ65948.1 hypothetical protein C7J99_28235 [Brevibacillus brevis]RED27859.1 hypothetical protein DES34_109152 [Brevibacillus brevis]TQK53922.1 hypothetical protein FB479_108137 [Brevibacillus sp. AG162]VEF86897.1 Uncharacterised protein [Brevibacillus brevis]GEC88697.1 hypothetical protein BBR01nite_10280 [Brevibacillus brevis]
MKKLVSVALLLSMLAVSACSNKPAETKPAEQNAAQTTEAAKTTEAPKTDSAAPAPTATTNDKLEAKKVLNDKVEILIPKGFTVMSEEMAKVKYPTENRPSLIYTDEKGSINIAFSHTETPAQDSIIKDMKDPMKQAFSNMYQDATWYRDEVIQINGKNVGVFELLTPAADTKIYNLIFFTELDGKMLMTTFNCTEAQMEEWKPLAQEILMSYKVQ